MINFDKKINYRKQFLKTEEYNFKTVVVEKSRLI